MVAASIKKVSQHAEKNNCFATITPKVTPKNFPYLVAITIIPENFLQDLVIK